MTYWTRQQQIAKEWREEAHPRGKTTPESTPGSFAPSAWRNDELKTIQYQIRKKKFDVPVLKNPTQDHLARFLSGEDDDTVRYSFSTSGDIFVWPATASIHVRVEEALRKAGQAKMLFFGNYSKEGLRAKDALADVRAVAERYVERNKSKAAWGRRVLDTLSKL